MNLENIMLSEIKTVTKRQIFYIIWCTRVVKIIDTESTMVVARGWGKEDTEFQFHKMKSSGDGWAERNTPLWMLKKSGIKYTTEPYKMVNFTCAFYHSEKNWGKSNINHTVGVLFN